MKKQDQWIDHSGVALPVSYHDEVEVKCRDGSLMGTSTAGWLEWVHEESGPSPQDIVSYRLIKKFRGTA